jgi:hypothetical protein
VPARMLSDKRSRRRSCPYRSMIGTLKYVTRYPLAVTRFPLPVLAVA